MELVIRNTGGQSGLTLFDMFYNMWTQSLSFFCRNQLLQSCIAFNTGSCNIALLLNQFNNTGDSRPPDLECFLNIPLEYWFREQIPTR